ncbi:SxtJ family membrane protein [Pleionea sediminis]|uniref:SxtJ family membrane protein n=1 Tax=Pleionea sediminis TaxID=2569479 RepID=UPI001184A0AA|nr:SxtJ family membrane protein [Pleionea sediminis]
MINIDATNHKELRRFALMMSIAIPFIFMALFPWIFNLHVSLWPLFVPSVLIPLSIMAPSLLYPIYWCWMKFALIMGWINTHIILTIVFIALIFPIGLVLRILGKLEYTHKVDDANTTFWKKSNNENDLERPF